MVLFSINRDPPRREVRLFAGLWLPLALLILAALLWRRFQFAGLAAGLVAAAAVVSLLGWRFPEVVRPVYLAALYATYPVGVAVSCAVLAATYYLVITPFAWIMRWRGRDVLGLTFDREASTYWVPHRAPDSKNRYFRQF